MREPLAISAARLREEGVVYLPQALDAATLTSAAYSAHCPAW